MEHELGLGTIEAVELLPHVERGDAFVLDLRRNLHGKQIYGSTRYNPKHIADAPKLILPLPKTGGLIVLYDDGDASDHVRELGLKLMREGYGGIRILRGGIAAWIEAGGRTQEPSFEQPVPMVTEQQLSR
ncbi:MAG: rhodanese-like domain-containing protein [Candidatus Eremiobacteraeota bacterium]|nr:rhodanese-like domain-containing protein [Candidatus Eremiobacteraeota bacterium]